MMPSDGGMAALLAGASLVCFFALTLFATSGENLSLKANTASFRSWVRSEPSDDVRAAPKSDVTGSVTGQATLVKRRS